MRTSRRSSALLVLFALVSSAFAQQSAKGKAAENATTALLQMNAAYLQTPAAQKSQLLTQFRGMAAQRQQLLISLIQTNPADVLRIAVPNNIRSTMPAAVQNYVEQTVQAQGVLEVLIEDSTTGSKMHYGLTTAAGKLSLHFADKIPTSLLTGAVVKVSGVQVGGDLALACCSSTTTNALQTAPSVLPNTFGAQSTLVILVNFQDNTSQPYTASTAQDVVFNQTSNFDLENSLQQTWLTGTVVGWYTLPMSSTTCDYTSIATYANQAASAAGVTLSNYKHYVYAFPTVSACGWWGLGTVGGSPSQAWINGSIALKVVSHEMGHNFGLYHSHAWSCGGTTLGSSCNSIEYGDSIDDMGSPAAGHFNAFQKERLGWLNYGISGPITTVQSDGTYSIGPYEAQDATAKGLKILQSTNPTTGAHTWYYVELRQGIGADSFLSGNSNVMNGVLVRTGTDADGNSSELLNMVPSQTNFSQGALDVGHSFVDTTAGITLQTMAAGPTGANVSVVFGTPVCAHYNPTISVSPYQSQTVQAGTTVTYTVNVVNNDNAGCNSSTFNLSGSVPSGWTAAYANPTLILAPGASASTSLSVTSPSGSATGIYNVVASGTNSTATSFSGSNSATYVLNTTPCINANPTVSLSLALNQSQSVSAGSTVTYLISVTNNDNSSCNSSSFRLTDAVPSGWASAWGVSSGSLTISPGAKASTYLYVTSPSTASGGTYNFTGTATNSTYSSGTYSGFATSTYVVAGGTTCNRANPSVSVSPSSQSANAGTAITYTVAVTDHDSSGCGSTNFNLASALPSSWSGIWNSPALSLTPGGNTAATLTVTSPVSASGSFAIGITATDAAASSYSGSSSATYVALTTTTTRSVSIATNSSTYSPGQMVAITVTVSSGGLPISGASVSVAVANPNGAVSSLSGTTGTNGIASLNYKLKKQAPAGTYQASATLVTSGAAPTAPATATFNVQ